MKKILAMLLTVAMLLSLIVVATVSVVAAEGEGMWTTMGNAAQYEENYFDDRKSVPGYEYTSDGFTVPAADWATNTPFVTIQSKEMVNLKAGVNMVVRVDEFSYEASDSWFNFHIWDSVNLDPGNGEDTFGTGVQTLLRPAKTGPAEDKDGNMTGSVASIAWYTEAFTSVGGSNIDAANRATVDVDGVAKDQLTLDIKFEGGTYVVTINGSAAPEKVITYMNEKYADGYAYIGFSMYNSQKGGTAAATVTSFNGEVPFGTDSADAENFYDAPVDIMDASTVPEGTPAIFMTGNRVTSDLKNIPSSSTGSKVEVTGDTITVTANGGTADFGTWRVDNEKSYDVADFPVIMCMTKDFCTCMGDSPADCFAIEEMSAYILVGDDIAPAPGNKHSSLDMCYEATVVDDSNYLYFYYDFSDDEASGRFNGVRFDAVGVDLVNEGFDTFEMVWVAMFRSVEEAEEYAATYLEALANGENPGIGGGEDEEDTTAPVVEETSEEVTTAPAGEETTAPAGEETTAPVVDETTAPVVDETTTAEETTTAGETSAVVETTKEETTKPVVENNEETTADEGGCGSFVGFGAMAIVATAAVAGMVSFKKKED